MAARKKSGSWVAVYETEQGFSLPRLEKIPWFDGAEEMERDGMGR